jgi:hypothetical protein
MMEEIPKRWVGGICVQDNQLLLIHRINKERDFNQEYFVFPGNTVEEDSSLATTLTEEFAQMSVQVTLGDLFYANEDNGDESEYYYLCTYQGGEVTIPEADETNDEQKQFYTPVWITLEELDDLVVYPESVKNLILEELEQEIKESA